MRLTHEIWDQIGDRQIDLITLEGADGMTARVSNYGGVLQSLLVRNGRGEVRDVVLGYERCAAYRADETFFGAMIGPIADRLDAGRCLLDGRTVQLPLNADPDAMHSGPEGFHNRVWDWKPLADGVALYRRFADGEGGFPGPMDVELCYRLTAPGTLRLTYRARCARETALSFTNHSYFNLDGGDDSICEHRLRVSARRYAETRRESAPIVTGRLLPVAGTPLDFEAGKPIGEALAHAEHAEIRAADGVDHYFRADGAGFREQARLESAKGALRLICSSDAPGLLVYSGNGLTAEPGKDGKIYGKHWGVCLETGRFPNAVNLPEHRADVLLAPGEVYESATEYRFEAL